MSEKSRHTPSMENRITISGVVLNSCCFKIDMNKIWKSFCKKDFRINKNLLNVIIILKSIEDR